MLCGIDEAGRGPPIGNLVMCGVLADKDQVKALELLGVADSKKLTKEKREELYPQIIKLVEYHVVVISPAEVDAAVLLEGDSLNKLELRKAVEIINALNPSDVIIDCPDTNIPSFTARMQSQVKANVVAEYKAEKYAVVAAASIIAKVLRDRSIEELQKLYKVDFGSGYAADPKTKQFLKENWNNHKVEHLIRKSWASYKNEKMKSEQKVLGGF